MVAGPRLEQALDTQSGIDAGADWREWPRTPLGRAVSICAIPCALYLLAVIALLSPWPFGALPSWAYNWEGYTAWRWATYWEPPVGPTFEIWAPTDGLMTDSGHGPLVGLPVSLGIAIAGFNVDAMRVPVALLAATSTPLLWQFARPVAGNGPAFLAALLLATSPAFLLYGRTATLVGVSLVPLLLTAAVLGRVVSAAPNAGWRWRREGFLVGTVMLGAFTYAPVRLLWPLTVVVLALLAIRQRDRRRVLLTTALACLLAAPVVTMILEQAVQRDPQPLNAALGYFNARGEHVVALQGEPSRVREYLREPASGDPAGWDPLLALIGQNSSDLARLLLDRDTGPVATEFWNPSGRFWPWFLAPFALIGAGWTVWRGLRGRPLSLLPFVLFAGFTTPLLLTSRVHVGRLLPALPFAMVLAAVGVWFVAGRLLDGTRGLLSAQPPRLAAPLVAGLVLIPTMMIARTEFAVDIPQSRESLTAALLADWHAEAAERGGATLVEDPALGDEIERVHAATYRLDLDRLYRFTDLQQPGPNAEDARPRLWWRGALAALTAGDLSAPCQRLWFVAPEVAIVFLDAWRAAGCSGVPDAVVLP